MHDVTSLPGGILLRLSDICGKCILFTCYLSLIIYLSNKLPTLQKLSTSEGYSTILPSISTSGQTTHSDLKTRHTKDLLSTSVEIASHTHSALSESGTPFLSTSLGLKSDFSKTRYASSVITSGFSVIIASSPAPNAAKTNRTSPPAVYSSIKPSAVSSNKRGPSSVNPTATTKDIVSDAHPGGRGREGVVQKHSPRL